MAHPDLGVGLLCHSCPSEGPKLAAAGLTKLKLAHLAIEQFQQTRRLSQFELHSYKMLGLCFAAKRGFNMLDLGIRQISRGLAVQGHSEREYQELRLHLVTLNYQAGRLSEALAVLRECYLIDIAYPGVQGWMGRIESELSQAQFRSEMACLVAAWQCIPVDRRGLTAPDRVESRPRLL